MQYAVLKIKTSLQMNKSIFILLFALLLIIGELVVAQQALEISFKARHYEGQDVGIDSIMIKNINRNCDTILYAPDTILYYNYFVGIDENLNLENNFVSAPYPNPILNNKTSFNINLYQTGDLNLELFDLLGRKLNTYNRKLSQGNYKFKINFGKMGTYILKANFNNKHKSLKIINGNHGTGDKFVIELVSIQTINKLKNQTIENGFWYEPGDTLWYVGYAQTPHAIAGSDVLESVPQNQEHLHFSIVEGLPCPEDVAVKHAGHLYPTVQIDDQCWLKENMNIGTMIHGDSTMKDNDIIEKYCYDNLPEYCDETGGLYLWWELMQYSEEEGTKGICPEGWHISTQDDLLSLVFAAGIGNTFKERGNSHWLPGYNSNGNNIRGFTALGTGYRSFDNSYKLMGKHAPFHSSTKMTYDWVFYLEFNQGSIVLSGTTRKDVGNAVRCIKD